MNVTAIKENLSQAQGIARETFGENPPPEIVAAVLNALTAQKHASQLSDAAKEVSNALFQNSR